MPLITISILWILLISILVNFSRCVILKIKENKHEEQIYKERKIKRNFLFFLLIIGMLVIFPLYSNENSIIEKYATDEKEDGFLDYWEFIFFANIGYSDQSYDDDTFSIGLDLTMANVYKPPFAVLQSFAIEYQYPNSQPTIRIDYTYARYAFVLGAGIGISGFYNIKNDDIGIAPKIGIAMLGPALRFNYYYRYNFVLNNMSNSYHEYIFSVSICIPMIIDYLLY